MKAPQKRSEQIEGLTVTAGDTAWKAHRDAIAQRNAETKKRAQVERESRDGIAGARIRAQDQHEAEQLVELNERIAKRRRRAR